ncbi:HTH_Tnp_Tc3_2 domain-containing protein [Trichonephila clavipes]|nr:HTH_Tnp_Tc3_2 domain-containing protein [Trichonephila clavipes]
MDSGQKGRDRTNCKGQLAFAVHVSKWTVQRSLHRKGFGSHRPTRVPLLDTRHWAARLAWAKDHRGWSVEDWELLAWSDDSPFRLLNANGKLRIWRQAHEAMDPTCQVGTVQGHGSPSNSINEPYSTLDSFTQYLTSHSNGTFPETLNLCLDMWQPLSSPEEARLVTR